MRASLPSVISRPNGTSRLTNCDAERLNTTRRSNMGDQARSLACRDRKLAFEAHGTQHSCNSPGFRMEPLDSNKRASQILKRLRRMRAALPLNKHGCDPLALQTSIRRDRDQPIQVPRAHFHNGAQRNRRSRCRRMNVVVASNPGRQSVRCLGIKSVQLEPTRAARRRCIRIDRDDLQVRRFAEPK